MSNFIPYKPFKYPFALEAFMNQNFMHWIPEEVSLQQDVIDFNNITQEEKFTIKSIFKFFTQSDIEVNDVYLNIHSAKDVPTELKMMFSAFANTEAIHIKAYSYLIETLHINEDIYGEFMTDPVLFEKYNNICSFKNNKDDELLTMLWFAIFIEGISLFGMFGILLRFTVEKGKFLHMGQILTWSMRDEFLHVTSMMKYTSHLCKERNVDPNILLTKLDNVTVDLFKLEHKFLENVLPYDLDFANSMKEHLQYLYVEYCNTFREYCNIPKVKNNYNYIPWMLNVGGYENVNFFNTEPTQYCKLSNSNINLKLAFNNTKG